MRLCPMDEERVAQIDSAGPPSGQDLVTVIRQCKPVGCELCERQSILPMWQQLPDDMGMGTFAEDCRGVVLSYIREQEEHQQRTAAAFHVDTPLHEVGIVQPETHIDMPATITGSSSKGNLIGKVPNPVGLSQRASPTSAS